MREIKLIKGNVERIALGEERARELELQGFKRKSQEEAAEETGTEKQLSEMTVDELRVLARNKGIAGCSVLRKSDLLQVLEGDGHDEYREAENIDGRA